MKVCRAVAVLAAAVFVAGCGNTTGSTTAGTGPGANSGVRQKCPVAELNARLLALRSPTQQTWKVLVVRNQGSRACLLSGAPRITLLSSAGQVIRRLPRTIADHRAGVTLRPGGVASVWLDLLAPGGTGPRGVSRIGFAITGITGRLSVPASRADRGDQQFIVSEVTAGQLTRLPPSTALPPTCAHVALSASQRPLGEWAGGSTMPIVLTNTTDRACSLGGIPKLSVSNPDRTLRYRPPQHDVGPSAKIVLAPHGHASAWTTYPDCGAFAGWTAQPSVPARNTIKLPGLPPISSKVIQLQSAWPAPRCAITVSAFTTGTLRAGPGGTWS